MAPTLLTEVVSRWRVLSYGRPVRGLTSFIRKETALASRPRAKAWSAADGAPVFTRSVAAAGAAAAGAAGRAAAGAAEGAAAAAAGAAAGRAAGTAAGAAAGAAVADGFAALPRK